MLASRLLNTDHTDLIRDGAFRPAPFEKFKVALKVRTCPSLQLLPRNSLPPAEGAPSSGSRRRGRACGFNGALKLRAFLFRSLSLDCFLRPRSGVCSLRLKSTESVVPLNISPQSDSFLALIKPPRPEFASYFRSSYIKTFTLKIWERLKLRLNILDSSKFG